MMLEKVRTPNGDEITIQTSRGYTGPVYTVYLNGSYVMETTIYKEAAAKVSELGGKP